MQSNFARGAVWMGVYLFFVLAPLLALLLGDLPRPRDFWIELSAALGYAGLALMGLQLGLTARFRFVTAPWGEDVIYHFHRNISLVALALVVAHPILIFAVQPHRLWLLNVFEAPPAALWAAASTYSLIALVVMSLWRLKLRLSYEWWHGTHIVLAVLSVLAGVVHMVMWGFYLGDPVKRALWIGLAVLWVGLLVYVRVFRALFVLRRPYRVTEVRPERGQSWTLVMKPEGHEGLRFRPGQFAWLSLWGSAFKITQHPFSFSGSAAAPDGRVEITIRELGDHTRRISQVAVGSRMYIDGPYGAFTSGCPSDTQVLIAGGVGITPMMSIIRTLADEGDKRPVILLYGSRDWDSITFREELEAIQPRLNLKVVHVLSDPPPGWAGETGYIDAAVLQRNVPAPHAANEYFICGPDVMMDAVETALAALQVPMSRYHSERYSFA
jgi:predicted ferric reductase